MEEKNKRNLLLKLKDALSVRLADSKIVRKLPALTLIATMAIQLTACDLGIISDLTSGIYGTTGPAYSTTAPLTPGTTEPSTTTSPSTTTGPQEQLTEILQMLLNDPYYANTIARGKNFPELLETGLFDPHPYGFLEDEGYDINAIKNNELLCNSASFILDEDPNSLYIATHVETKASEPYYTEYMLKYPITDIEREIYMHMHESKIGLSVFLNDIISQTRDPEVISEAKATVKAHKDIEAVIKSSDTAKELLNNNIVGSILFRNIDVENGTFDVYLLPTHGGNVLQASRPMALMYCEQDFSKFKLNENGALVSPGSYFGLTDISTNQTQQQVKIFRTQNLDRDINLNYSVDSLITK